MVRVRPYRQSDRDDLWELKREFELSLATDDEKATAYREKLDEEYRREYLDWVSEATAESERTVQVAIQDTQLVGYVFVLPESLSYIWDAAVLNELFVREPARGGAVADALMDAALSLARDQSLPLERILLDVDPTNSRARTFYERWGFETWGDVLSRDL